MPNWLNQLLGLPTDDAKALTLSMTPGGFVTELRGLPNTAYQTDTTALQGTQLRNELVYACIDTKATAALDPRLIVQQRVRRDGRDVYEEVPDHPFRHILMRPNADMTESDLMKAAIVSWDVSNPRRFFCEKEYTNGLLTALYPLDPSRMVPLASRADSTKMIGYEWRDGATRREYSFDDLLIRRAPAWYDPPPLVAALGAIDSDTAQTDFIRAFFQNGGIPPGILKYNLPLNDAQRTQIRDSWAAMYGNRYGNAQTIGVLDVNVEYQQTGARLDQLSSDTLRSVAESRICMAFKVPPLIVYAYVGLLRATYSNLKEAWAGFWDATMSPAFREWRMFWMWSLLSEFENEATIRSEAIRLQYDMSQVAALQDDVDAIQRRAKEAWQAGALTLNEYRSTLGLASDPEGDYYLRSLATLPTPMGSAPASQATEAAKAQRQIKARTTQVIERQMQRDLSAYLASEYRTAAQAAREGA